MLKIILTVFLLVLVFDINAQSDNEAEAAIMENFNYQVECWNKGDIDCFVKAYVKSDSTRLIGKNGIIYGYDNILAKYKRSWKRQNMGVLSFENISMEKLSDIYYFVTGKFTVIFKDGKEPHEGYFSAIMKKVGGEWFIYTDHSG